MSKTRDTERREKMPELNEAHFEVIDKNKAEQHERQKIKFLEDRITTLEKSIERLNKIVSIWKLGQEENNHE
jgi:TolA-binding protein